MIESFGIRAHWSGPGGGVDSGGVGDEESGRICRRAADRAIRSNSSAALPNSAAIPCADGESAASPPPVGGSRAVLSPHAGWFFVGKLIALAAASLPPDTDTIVVCGGHLPSDAPALFWMEDAVETPFGLYAIDCELRDSVIASLGGLKNIKSEADGASCNSVEIPLPIAKYFFSKSKLLALRAPPRSEAFDLGQVIAREACALGRRAAFIASSDLTHYGRGYGFFPKGFGEAALDWVKNENDRAFINASLKKDPRAVLENAEKNSSACSAGAVAAALGFLKADSPPAASSGRLLHYTTSADVLAAEGEKERADSFVGYAAIAWE